MNEKVTIYDIAKKLNITAATVSRALNNNPKISDSTKKLVLETAKAMNYKPNKLALALKSGKSKNIAVVVPYIDRAFFSTIIRGIEEELYPKGYHTIICQTHEEEQKEKDTLNALLNTQIDGIMISVAKNTKDLSHFKDVIDKNVPLIFFDRTKDLDGVSTVTINDVDGGYQATSHLIDQGCKRIAHLTVDMDLKIYQERYRGYLKALEEHGLEAREDYLIKAKSDAESDKAAVDTLLALNEPPDAIFSASDFTAMGAIKELQRRNIRIPEDFCVVGFSNEPFTRFMELSISSVDQTPIEMGKMCAKVFLEQVASPHLKIEKKVVLSPTLEKRKSSSKS